VLTRQGRDWRSEGNPCASDSVDKDVFSRKPFLKELRTAIDNGKPIIAVKESEEHCPGYAPIDHVLGTVLSFCRDLFDKVNVMGMRRYSYEEDGFHTELIRRIATAK